MHRLVRHAITLGIALITVVAIPVVAMAQEATGQGSVWDSLAHPSFRAGQNGQVYYRGNTSPAAPITTGPVNLDWRALYQIQMRVNQGQDAWRLDPVQVARIESARLGFAPSADTYTLFNQVEVGQYSGTGEAQVLVQHGRQTYVIDLIQPFGPGPGMMWTTSSIREITSPGEANWIARVARITFEYRGPNGPAVATWNPAPTPPRQNPPARSGRIVYYVQPGDTLWAISVRYGVTTYRLIDLNPGLNANALWIGQVIIIQDGGNTWTPTPGNNGGSGVPSVNRVHIVEPGDTLWQIAVRYSASIKAIMNANGITDANTLWVGQRLIIP